MAGDGLAVGARRPAAEVLDVKSRHLFQFRARVGEPAPARSSESPASRGPDHGTPLFDIQWNQTAQLDLQVHRLSHSSAPASISASRPRRTGAGAAYRWLRLLHIHLLCFHRLAAGGAAAVSCICAWATARCWRGWSSASSTLPRWSAGPGPGRITDHLGAKVSVLWGMAACTASGALLVGAAALHPIHWLSFAVLVVSRLVLGVGESLGSTGSTLWGITSAGPGAHGQGDRPTTASAPMAAWRWARRWAWCSISSGAWPRSASLTILIRRGQLRAWPCARARSRSSPASICPSRTCWAAWLRTAWAWRWAA